jgi:hypothetical protein
LMFLVSQLKLFKQNIIRVLFCESENNGIVFCFEKIKYHIVFPAVSCKLYLSTPQPVLNP